LTNKQTGTPHFSFYLQCNFKNGCYGDVYPPPIWTWLMCEKRLFKRKFRREFYRSLIKVNQPTMSTKKKLLMRGNGYSFIYEGKTQVPQLTIIIGTFFLMRILIYCLHRPGGKDNLDIKSFNVFKKKESNRSSSSQ